MKRYVYHLNFSETIIIYIVIIAVFTVPTNSFKAEKILS